MIKGTLNSISMLVLFLTIFACNQEKRPEVIYQDCVYDSLLDNGEAFMRFMKGFEKHLVQIEILNDTTAAGYYSLLKLIADKNNFPETYEYSYIDSINSIERYKINPYNSACFEMVNTLVSFNNSERNSKAREFNDFIKDNSIDFSEALNKKLKNLKKDDLELDYYKHKTFMYLYLSSFQKYLESLD